MDMEKKTYRTLETLEEGDYVTLLLDKSELKDFMFLSNRLRILDIDFDAYEMVLGLCLEGDKKDFSTSYALVGYDEIKSFLKDMQVIGNFWNSKKEVLALKGRTLDGIFDNSRELYGLCPTAHKGELSLCLFDKLRGEIQRRKEEMRAGNSG